MYRRSGYMYSDGGAGVKSPSAFEGEGPFVAAGHPSSGGRARLSEWALHSLLGLLTPSTLQELPNRPDCSGLQRSTSRL